MFGGCRTPCESTSQRTQRTRERQGGTIPAPRVLTAWLTRQGVRVMPETNPSHRPLDHEGRHRYRRARTIHSPQSCRSYRLRQTRTTTVRASCCGMRDRPAAACPARWSRTAVHTPCTSIPEWAWLLPPCSITAQHHCVSCIPAREIVVRRAQPRKFPLRERVMERADDTVHHSRRLAVPRPGEPGRWSVVLLPERPRPRRESRSAAVRY